MLLSRRSSRRKRRRRRCVSRSVCVRPGAELLSVSALLSLSVAAARRRPKHPQHGRQVGAGPVGTVGQGRAHRSVPRPLCAFVCVRVCVCIRASASEMPLLCLFAFPLRGMKHVHSHSFLSGPFETPPLPPGASPPLHPRGFRYSILFVLLWSVVPVKAEKLAWSLRLPFLGCKGPRGIGGEAIKVDSQRAVKCSSVSSRD